MPLAPAESRSSGSFVFFTVAILFAAGFAAFFTWSYTQRQASREAVAAQREIARARDEAEAVRARAERAIPASSPSVAAPPNAAPQSTSTGTPLVPRRPAVRELPNGDREVTLLDGTVALQPMAELPKFALFAAGEPNPLGLPSGVLPDGSWVYENMPVTVEQNGKRVAILTRALATPVTGAVAEGDDAPVKRN